MVVPGKRTIGGRGLCLRLEMPYPAKLTPQDNPM